MRWTPYFLLMIAVIIIIFVNMGQLKYPLDSQDKEILKRFLDESLKEKVFDAEWDSNFYYLTFFETIDRLTTAGTPTLTVEGISLVTDTDVGTFESAALGVPAGDFLKYRKSYFRTLLKIDPVANTILSVYFLEDDALDNYFGFRITNGTIRGISSYEGTETTLVLTTVLGDTYVTLEGRYVPGDGVVFLINGVERGKIITNLPNVNADIELLFSFVLENSGGVAKESNISYLQFIQEK